MFILFDSLVIRVKQLILSLGTIAFILLNHLDWLSFLHISKVASDRLEFLFIILVAINRPAGYVDTNWKLNKEENRV